MTTSVDFPVIVLRWFERGCSVAYAAGRTDLARSVSKLLSDLSYPAERQELSREHPDGLLIGHVSPDANCLDPHAADRLAYYYIVALVPRDASEPLKHEVMQRLRDLPLPVEPGEDAALHVRWRDPWRVRTIEDDFVKTETAEPRRWLPFRRRKADKTTVAPDVDIKTACLALERQLFASRRDLGKLIESCTPHCMLSDVRGDTIAGDLDADAWREHLFDADDPKWRFEVDAFASVVHLVASCVEGRTRRRLVRSYSRSRSGFQLARSAAFRREA